jgi:hypothetical protein
VLDDAILQRVKGDHGEPGPREQPAAGLHHERFQLIELAIHPDAYRLEGPGRRVDSLISAAGNRAPHDLSELPGRRDRAAAAGFDDRASDPSGIALLAILENQVRELLLADLIEQISGRRPLRLIHPHVERLVATEAETAAFAVELHGRHAEVRKRTVDTGHTTIVENAPKLTVVGMHQLDAIAKSLEPLAGNLQRLGVTVQAEQLRSARFEENARMPAEPDGTIHEQTTARGVQQRDRLCGHDRFVNVMGHQIPNSASERASSSV